MPTKHPPAVASGDPSQLTTPALIDIVQQVACHQISEAQGLARLIITALEAPAEQASQEYPPAYWAAVAIDRLLAEATDKLLGAWEEIENRLDGTARGES